MFEKEEENLRGPINLDVILRSPPDIAALVYNGECKDNLFVGLMSGLLRAIFEYDILLIVSMSPIVPIAKAKSNRKIVGRNKA